MRFIFSIIVILWLSVSPVFSQSNAREQGLVTSDPYWRQALGGAVLSLPSVQAQSAVVALDGGNIRAYSTAGTPMWNYSARGRISPYVTRSREGTSYFSRVNGIFIAVNRAGRELWRRQLDGPLCARVITGWDGRLFVPTDKKMYCYTASGNLLWTRTFDESFLINPVLDRSGGIICAFNNNEIYRIDPYGSAHIWMLSNTPAILISLTQNSTQNAAQSPSQQRVVVLYTDGAIEELGVSEDWYTAAHSDDRITAMPRLPARPLAATGRGSSIAVTMSDGKTVLLSIDERKILWSGDSHMSELINRRGRPEPEVEMLFDERGIYVLNKNGATGFSHEGRRLWFTFIPDAASVPAFGNDGVLYSGGRDWILYAYKIEDRVLPVRNALYGPIAEGSYGMGRPRPPEPLEIPLNEYETKRKLEEIEKEINAGRMSANEPEWTSFLLHISAGDRPIQFRIAAIGLLGKIGSQETIPWLINIFNRDNEPFIKVAAINAIGEIGVDPNGTAIQTFSHSIIQGVKDDLVLTAIASATGALCRFSGPPLSETGIRILNMIAAGNQPPMARRQAGRELASLR